MKAALVAHGAENEQTSTGSRNAGVHEGLESMGFHVTRIVVGAHARRWHRRPRQWWYFRGSAELNARIRQEIPSDAALIVLSYLPVAAIALSEVERSFPNAMRIYDALNDEPELTRRTMGRWSVSYAARLERHVVARVNGVTVAGLEDLDRMARRYPGRRMANLPHAVDPARPTTPSNRRDRTLFTYGNWRWQANHDGLLRLAAVHDVPGHVRVYGEVPDRLRDEVLRRAAGGAVTWSFCGFASHLDQMAEDAACPMLMPVWSGAGVKSRTAQMSGRGVPVFGPPESIRGLPEWFATGVVVESRPDELLRRGFDCGTQEWARALELGKRLQREYSWPALVEAALADLGVRTVVS